MFAFKRSLKDYVNLNASSFSNLLFLWRYFTMRLPAAFFIKKDSYKTGILLV